MSVRVSEFVWGERKARAAGRTLTLAAHASRSTRAEHAHARAHAIRRPSRLSRPVRISRHAVASYQPAMALMEGIEEVSGMVSMPRAPMSASS